MTGNVVVTDRNGERTSRDYSSGTCLLYTSKDWRRKQMNKVRLGIIGYGSIGSQHGRSIKAGKTPAVELTAVARCV